MAITADSNGPMVTGPCSAYHSASESQAATGTTWGVWWSINGAQAQEFLAVLISCTSDAPAVQWLSPFAVLDSLGIVQAFNQAHPDLIVKNRTVCLTDQYSDDVPYRWVVGTAVIRFPDGCPIRNGVPLSSG
jgi:hypothetical protein